MSGKKKNLPQLLIPPFPNARGDGVLVGGDNLNVRFSCILMAKALFSKLPDRLIPDYVAYDGLP